MLFRLILMKVYMVYKKWAGANPDRLNWKRQLDKVLMAAPVMCSTCKMYAKGKCFRYNTEVDINTRYMLQKENNMCPYWLTYDSDDLYPEDDDEIPF